MTWPREARGAQTCMSVVPATIFIEPQLDVRTVVANRQEDLVATDRFEEIGS